MKVHYITDKIEYCVGLGARMSCMRKVIGGNAAAEFGHHARVSRNSRFSLGTETSNAKGER